MQVLAIFSRSFAKSDWCQFELNLCLTHALHHDDVIVVTCLDDVTQTQLMTSAMTALLKTTTYIQWQDVEDARQSFWGRVQISLEEVINDDQQNIE